MTSLVSVVPFTLINDKIQIRDYNILELLNGVPSDYSFINFNDTGNFQFHDPELHQKAFLNVISCTVFDYPNVFNSEKNFKPIVNLRPFVLVSSPGSLENMRKAGFKTFSDYWSEDYDKINDPVNRMKTIVNLIEVICSKSLDELKAMLIDMQDILQHNHKFYFELFVDHELKNFDQACSLNLGIQ